MISGVRFGCRFQTAKSTLRFSIKSLIAVEMPELIPLIPTSELPPGASAECVADGRVFAAFNVDGVYRVIDGICPHAGGPLGKGELSGSIVTCPWHGWQFDVESGAHCLNRRLCQTTYETEVVDGMLTIRTETTDSKACDVNG